MDKFIITDAAGNSQKLFVTNTDIDTLMRNINLELPPIFPELPFDSRFQYDEYVKRVNSDSGVVSLEILVHSFSFPITLTWELNPNNNINYSFIGDTGLGKNKDPLTTLGKIAFNDLSEGKIKFLAQVTDANTNPLNIPVEFSLKQNYPNPFNPSTWIQYEIPKTAMVKLTIYDVLGQEVRNLVNEIKEPGRYTVNFDASSLTSGVYIYKITAGKYTSAKKMMLVK